MVVAPGILLQIFASTVTKVAAIFDSSDVDEGGNLIVPGRQYEDTDIAGALNDKARSAGINGNFDEYVSEMHRLYYDSEKPKGQYNKYQNDHVHFHNWDHGRNVWSLAHWYGTEKGGLQADQQFLLELAALSHDVMHPGLGKNIESDVTRFFLPQVKSWSTKEWTLDDYARNLLSETNLEETICDVLPCATLSDQDAQNAVTVLKKLAPQELLHSWITMKLLKKHAAEIFNDKNKLKRLVEAILMTSITAHFALLFSRDGAQKLAQHVGASTTPIEGLLLHLFDMGYLCQTGMKVDPDGGDIGIRFAARYLIESGNPPDTLEFWDNVTKSQNFFSGIVVGKYLQDFGTANKIPNSILGKLQAGVTKFQRWVLEPGTIGLKSTVETEASRITRARTSYPATATNALANANKIQSWTTGP